jgi:PEGA domain
MSSIHKPGIRIIRGALLLTALLAILITCVHWGMAGQLAGSIGISSVPTHASIYLDNKLVGVTPYTIKGVLPGQHAILLTSLGYASYTSQVSVQPDQVTSVYAILLPKPTVALLTGSLAVSSTPTGATIYLDDRQVGVTPYTIPAVSAGQHSVLMTYPGYEGYIRQVTVQPGKTTPLYAILLQKTPIASSTGSIKITTTPAGATIYLDNRLVGITPYTIPAVPAGQHTILLTRLGYYPSTQQVSVPADKTTPVSAVLLLNPSIFY